MGLFSLSMVKDKIKDVVTTRLGFVVVLSVCVTACVLSLRGYLRASALPSGKVIAPTRRGGGSFTPPNPADYPPPHLRGVPSPPPSHN